MPGRSLLALCLLPLALQPRALRAQPSSLLPVPTSLRSGAGRLVLDSTTTFVLGGVRDARLVRAVDRASARLAQRLAQPLAAARDSAPPRTTISIDVAAAGMPVQGLAEDEGYRLAVREDGATLTAASTVGALRGLETLLQLVESDSATHFIAALEIDDAPRFPWRGLLIDVARHFMPVEQVKRTIDGMALVKLNVLHWHLSDDQGFRVESRRFPRLHERGSDGLYYTQAQLREVVRYAHDRGIRVVPEFDMPGHTTAWLAGYPEFGTRPSPVAIRRAWGGADAILDPTREATYTFLASFIAEMVPLFPDAYWHIGGDEVEAKHWDGNARIVAWRRRHGLTDNAALQAHFNRRVSAILERHGRRMVGWDEILHPDLPPRTVVQSWRGVQYLANSAKQGFAALLSAPWYLDYMKPASEFYTVEPVPQFDLLTPAQRALVLGGEACMWAEFVSDETADSRIWPRLGAVAERLWSPREVTDVADLYRRLDPLTDRLEGMGLRIRSHPARMLARIAPGVETAPLESLFTAVQPPRFGQTVDGRQTTQRHPLTRLVDAAPPDPTGRWTVERLVLRLARDPRDAPARDTLLVLFERWSLLLPQVEALAARSPVLAEAIPVARALARSAVIGTEAVGFVTAGRTAPADWARAAAEELRRYEAPQGTMRVAIVPDVRKLLAMASERPATDAATLPPPARRPTERPLRRVAS